MLSQKSLWVYYVQGQYEEALKYFFEAEKLGDIENYNSIAYCAYMLNNYDLALDYANKMIFLARIIKMPMVIIGKGGFIMCQINMIKLLKDIFAC